DVAANRSRVGPNPDFLGALLPDEHFVGPAGRKNGAGARAGYSIDAQTMQSASRVLVLSFVPVMRVLGYPRMARIGLPTTMIAKMAMGCLGIAISFVMVGLYQNHLDRGGSLSILWQLLAYVPLEIGEVMLSVTGLEFAYANAPARMKSV